MPQYTVKDTGTGKTITFQWNGDKPPSEIDMQDVFSAAKEIKSDRSMGQKVYENVVTPTLELGGLAAGGAIGAAGGPVGSVLGAGLGFAGGKKLAKVGSDILGYTEPGSFTGSLSQTGKDIVSGATAEMTGGIAGNLFTRGASKVARALYEGALKPVPSLPRAQREAAISTGLERSATNTTLLPTKETGAYRPTADHVLKTWKNVNNLVDQADDIVVQASKRGDVIKTKSLTDAIDGVISEFKQGPFPVSDIKQLQSMQKELVRQHGTEIPVENALLMKKRIYQMASKFYKNPNVSIAPVKIEAEKAVARGIKQELETLYPATGPLNRKASELIDFGKVLERASNRVGNRELLSIFDYLGGTVGGAMGGHTGAAIGGISSFAATNAQFKSFLAKEIYKTSIPNNIKTAVIGQVWRYGVAKGTEQMMENQ